MVASETLGTLSLIPRPMMLAKDWPIYALDLAMIAALLAASLIDAETFTIPIEIPWVIAAVGIVTHAIIDKPSLPGALNLTPEAGALAAGGAVGLAISIALFVAGIIPVSFPEGEPMQDLVIEEGEAPPTGPVARMMHGLRAVLKYLLPILLLAAVAWLLVTQRPAVAVGGVIAVIIAALFWMLGKYPVGFPIEEQGPDQPPAKTWSRGDLVREMRKEMAFLLPPMLLAAAWWLITTRVPALGHWWTDLFAYHWFSGLLGATLGALVGGFVVWITRILGTLGFGRLAMGLGDVHLMFGVGAIVGAGAATVAFFLAPFFGIAIAIWMLLTGSRREIPYGPYLSLASAFVLLFYCPIAAYLAPGMSGLALMLRQMMGM
jgi:prepilin signal peptidase PulO-like enzyme (type II secretory pathway)